MCAGISGGFEKHVSLKRNSSATAVWSPMLHRHQLTLHQRFNIRAVQSDRVGTVVDQEQNGKFMWTQHSGLRVVGCECHVTTVRDGEPSLLTPRAPQGAGAKAVPFACRSPKHRLACAAAQGDSRPGWRKSVFVALGVPYVCSTLACLGGNGCAMHESLYERAFGIDVGQRNECLMHE